MGSAQTRLLKYAQGKNNNRLTSYYVIKHIQKFAPRGTCLFEKIFLESLCSKVRINLDHII